MNGTQSALSCYNPTAANIGQTFAYCLIFVVSMAGNIFIEIIVYKTKTMRKTINFLIVNMATSDLLFTILAIPRVLTELYVDSWLISGLLGQVLCKLVPVLPYVSMTVSVQSLVLLSVDRSGAVVFPLRSPLISSKLCSFFILATWIVAIAAWSPYILSFELVKFSGGLACARQWNEAFEKSSSYPNYMLAMLVVFVYTPLVLIAILYAIIYLKVKTQTIPGEQSVNMRQQRVKRERNVLKMAMGIVLGFAVCWLPRSIGLILFLFVSDIRSCGFLYFGLVAYFMARANCAINPCICFIFSGNYRKALRNLLKCFGPLQGNHVTLESNLRSGS
ncbi:neuropeptide SIFamide receptor-like [Oculina patagonica]